MRDDDAHVCKCNYKGCKRFGFECTVISDACATKDLEFNGEKVEAAEVQSSFMAAMSYFDASVINTESFIATMK